MPGLLLTLGNNGKTTALTIVGPVGLENVVSALTVIVPVLPYPIKLEKLKGSSAGELEKDGMNIASLPLNHGIPCLGYLITVKQKPIFNPQKANQLNVPKNLFKTLHAGQAVHLEDGREITPLQKNPVQNSYGSHTLALRLPSRKRILQMLKKSFLIPVLPMMEFTKHFEKRCVCNPFLHHIRIISTSLQK